MNVEILWTLFGLLAILLVDAALGVALAWKKGNFSWSSLAGTIKANVLPYVMPLGVLGGLASVEEFTPLAAVFVALTAGYTTKLIADIWSKIAELYGLVRPTTDTV